MLNKRRSLLPDIVWWKPHHHLRCARAWWKQQNGKTVSTRKKLKLSHWTTDIPSDSPCWSSSSWLSRFFFKTMAATAPKTIIARASMVKPKIEIASEPISLMCLSSFSLVKAQERWQDQLLWLQFRAFSMKTVAHQHNLKKSTSPGFFFRWHDVVHAPLT